MSSGARAPVVAAWNPPGEAAHPPGALDAGARSELRNASMASLVPYRGIARDSNEHCWQEVAGWVEDVNRLQTKMCSVRLGSPGQRDVTSSDVHKRR